MSESTVNIGTDALRAIRDALLIGLTCYGEIEERSNAQELAELGGDACPEGMRILHPTGTCDVVSTFAAALSCVSTAMEPARRAGE